MGYPLQQIENFLGAGVKVGLGFDSIALSGNADMFRTMKMVQDTEKIRNQAQFKISSRRVLELATIGGARCLDLDDKIGSLTPGKRADLIMVSLLAPNMASVPDPANLLVNSAAPANVDWSLSMAAFSSAKESSPISMSESYSLKPRHRSGRSASGRTGSSDARALPVSSIPPLGC